MPFRPNDPIRKHANAAINRRESKLMNIDKDAFNKDGYVFLRSLFSRGEVEQVRQDAKGVFIRQMKDLGILPSLSPTEAEFESALYRFFTDDQAAFVNCGKHIQHLVSLHRLGVDERVVELMKAYGIEAPCISTRPVLFFNSRHLATKEAYWKTPPHQDWRSIQGSLNSLVLWLPLVDIDKSLGALEIVPGSHLRGLLSTRLDESFGVVDDIAEEEWVPVPVSAGDGLLFSTFLIHRSGNNTTRSIRWSCHFRYNDLAEDSFIKRRYPHTYLYKPKDEIITHGFPQVSDLERTFASKS